MMEDTSDDMSPVQRSKVEQVKEFVRRLDDIVLRIRKLEDGIDSLRSEQRSIEVELENGVKRQISCAQGWLKRSEQEDDPVKRLRMIYECFDALRRPAGW